MAENTPSMAEKSPIERLAEKKKNEELAAQRDSEIKPSSAPITPREAAASGQAVNEGAVDPTKPAETAEGKPLNLGQGENANGELESKANFEEGSFDAQGHTKITREAGSPPEEKPVDVVQQGGGGIVSGSTGQPIR